MNLKGYNYIFMALGLIGILLLATPVVSSLLPSPKNEPFTEIYMLGPEHKTDNYPSTIVVGQNYSLYIGVSNHMASSEYYLLSVKLANQNDSLPNQTTLSSSSAQPLSEYRLILEDGNESQRRIDFMINSATFSSNRSTITNLEINGVSLNLNKPAYWDTSTQGFYYRLVFELWIYNAQSQLFEYNNRFLSLPFNLTNTLTSS